MITTTVGSYPKVAEGAYGTTLMSAIAQRQRQELNDEQLEATLQGVAKAVIREQEEAGLDLLTDGQIRWEDLVTPFAQGIDGFEINGLSRWFNNNVYYRRPILRAAPKRRGQILVHQYRFAASCTTKPVKAILPGPYTMATASEDRHFTSERRFVMTMAELLNAEARDLQAAGAAFIQFDEPALSFGKPNVALALEALKVATAGLTATTALYTYFGPLNGALNRLLNAPVDVIGIDAVSDPSAVAKLKRAESVKALALGCLDARNTKLESVAAIRQTLRSLERIVGADRLYVNPSCGLEFLPHAQALAKVRRLVEAVKPLKKR